MRIIIFFIFSILISLLGELDIRTRKCAINLNRYNTEQEIPGNYS